MDANVRWTQQDAKAQSGKKKLMVSDVVFRSTCEPVALKDPFWAALEAQERDIRRTRIIGETGYALLRPGTLLSEQPDLYHECLDMLDQVARLKRSSLSALIATRPKVLSNDFSTTLNSRTRSSLRRRWQRRRRRSCKSGIAEGDGEDQEGGEAEAVG
jgi:hypothetical protein